MVQKNVTVSSRRGENLRLKTLNRQLRKKISQLESALRAAQAGLAVAYSESRKDSLTGLCNRRRADEFITFAHAYASRNSSSYSIILIDVDYFKNVNDTYGHSEGDNILRCVAQILKSIGRSSDLVARWGGEEFSVLILDSDLSHAMSFAERIRKKISTKVKTPDGKSVTASFGVAQYKADEKIDSLIKRADVALYAAKEAGRNCVKMAQW